MDIIKSAGIWVDTASRFQTVDGFGVNINSKYWRGGELSPVMDLLVKDLGATLFRLDCYGRANWVDPKNMYDGSVLTQKHYNEIYESDDFQNALGMSLYLNKCGIEPYITVSGIAPRWMCGQDGKTLEHYGQYADMIVNYASWLKKNGVQFSLLGPLNETDLGPPEGPLLPPEQYAAACEVIVETLDKYGLTDVNLVVAEQAGYNLDYVREMMKRKSLEHRIGAFSMHAYGDLDCTSLIEEVKKEENSGFHRARCWMGEFGVLDQGGGPDDYIAWRSAETLFRLLGDGMNGAIYWDAYDNYHDHDECWTTFGLLKNTWQAYTPKKRYYALKHIFRYVKPGMVRVGASCSLREIPVLAFEDDIAGQLTVAGMNPSNEAVYIGLRLDNRYASGYQKFRVFRTCGFENCADVTEPTVKLHNRTGTDIELIAMPHSIFTVTNAAD